MSSMIKPDWWDLWVIQGLYKTVVRDNAPKEVKKSFKKFVRDQEDVKGVIRT